VNEFELIDCIVAELGDAADAPWVRVGPGDDAAVTRTPAGSELVSSIDALVGGVHFPLGGGGEGSG
jgi:thiamine-monophosphate kinase